ncbi:MAG: hypothetical protein AAGG80_01430, partial [Pseudomonadota bacterium]
EGYNLTTFMNVKDIRRINLRSLAQKVGGITSVAKILGKSQSQISHLIGANPVKNIGDNLAQQIERCFNKPPGWLDKEAAQPMALDINQMQHKQLAENMIWVPVLTPEQLLTIDINKLSHSNNEFSVIPINQQLGYNLFGLRIFDSDIAGLRLTPEVKTHAIAIIAPQARLENYGYILAASHFTETPKIRQVITTDTERFLAMLTPDGKKMVLNEQTKLYGVVKKIILNLE